MKINLFTGISPQLYYSFIMFVVMAIPKSSTDSCLSITIPSDTTAFLSV